MNVGHHKVLFGKESKEGERAIYMYSGYIQWVNFKTCATRDAAVDGPYLM